MTFWSSCLRLLSVEVTGLSHHFRQVSYAIENISFPVGLFCSIRTYLGVILGALWPDHVSPKRSPGVKLRDLVNPESQTWAAASLGETDPAALLCCFSTLFWSVCLIFESYDVIKHLAKPVLEKGMRENIADILCVPFPNVTTAQATSKLLL